MRDSRRVMRRVSRLTPVSKRFWSAALLLCLVLSLHAIGGPVRSVAEATDINLADSDEADQLPNHLGPDSNGADDDVKDFDEAQFFNDQHTDAPGAGLKGSDASTNDKASAIPPQAYQKPKTEGLLFAETFDGDVMTRWVKSSHPVFSGKWAAVKREKEALIGDIGLRVMSEAHRHAIATKMSGTGASNNKGQGLVVSYEVKLEKSLECGGAYLKLFHTDNIQGTVEGQESNLDQFSNDVRYSIMFGPDRCGDTRKVHTIIQHKNPISGKWVEHHLRGAPDLIVDELTHLYTLEIKPDNTFRVLVDNVVKREGSMATEFDPPFTPSKTIPDPDDKKPANWVDNPKMPDLKATKPADWDEDAPAMIFDENASIPDGWLEDEPLKITDPDAVKPETWDDDKDGEWKPPMIRNPACKDAPGCGKWSPPQIPNPKYRGKWTPPLIPNPVYKGPWTPREIPNPHYFVNEHPHAVADFNAVGFELWTMQSGILFDNIVIARDMKPVADFIDQTWKIRSKIEISQLTATAAPSAVEKLQQAVEGTPLTFSKKLEEIYTLAAEYATEYPVAAIGLATASIVTLLVQLLFGVKATSKKTTTTTTETNNADAKKPTDSQTTSAHPKDDSTSNSAEDSDDGSNTVAGNDRASSTTAATVSEKEGSGKPRKRVAAAKKD